MAVPRQFTQIWIFTPPAYSIKSNDKRIFVNAIDTAKLFPMRILWLYSLRNISMSIAIETTYNLIMYISTKAYNFILKKKLRVYIPVYL